MFAILSALAVRERPIIKPGWYPRPRYPIYRGYPVEKNEEEENFNFDWRKAWDEFYREFSKKNGEEEDNSIASVIGAFLGGLFNAQAELESNDEEDENFVNIDWKHWWDEFYRGFSMKNGEEEDDNSWQSILGAFIRGLVDSKQEVEDNGRGEEAARTLGKVIKPFIPLIPLLLQQDELESNGMPEDIARTSGKIIKGLLPLVPLLFLQEDELESNGRGEQAAYTAGKIIKGIIKIIPYFKAEQEQESNSILDKIRPIGPIRPPLPWRPIRPPIPRPVYRG